MTDEPHRMLPLCSVCGQRVPISGALFTDGSWQCLSHTKPEATRSHRLAAAGFLRRPSPYSLPSDGE